MFFLSVSYTLFRSITTGLTLNLTLSEILHRIQTKRGEQNDLVLQFSSNKRYILSFFFSRNCLTNRIFSNVTECFYEVRAHAKRISGCISVHSVIPFLDRRSREDTNFPLIT